MLSVPEGGYPQSSEVAGRPGGGNPRHGGLAKANREITVALILPTIGNAVFDELYNNETREALPPTSLVNPDACIRSAYPAKPSFFSFYARPRSPHLSFHPRDIDRLSNLMRRIIDPSDFDSTTALIVICYRAIWRPNSFRR